MVYSMPVVFIALPLVWLALQFSFPIKIKDITAAKNEIKNQVASAGKISKNELTVLIILSLTVIMWIIFSQPEITNTYGKYYGLAVVAVIGGILLFFTGLLNWKDVEKRVPWGIILLYGGAITLGLGIEKSGAGNWIANGLFSISGDNLFILILAIILITVILTNIMSNIAAVAILLPIGISVANNLQINPLLTAMIIALSGGLAFMFVISTPGNAITYSSGYFSTKDLLKAGFISNILCILVIFIVAILYWVMVLGLDKII
jgi:sodium-dependent dicarboxylate transporter 2/3/5